MAGPSAFQARGSHAVRRQLGGFPGALQGCWQGALAESCGEHSTLHAVCPDVSSTRTGLRCGNDLSRVPPEGLRVSARHLSVIASQDLENVSGTGADVGLSVQGIVNYSPQQKESLLAAQDQLFKRMHEVLEKREAIVNMLQTNFPCAETEHKNAPLYVQVRPSP